MEKINILAVVGPTASGKTRLSVELAKSIGGEVVSADSMQIYKNVNIATAKPSVLEMGGIRHHLIDIKNICDEFSVSDYVKLAKVAINDITGRGNIPIICGGTGLYVDLLLNDTEFYECGKDEHLRKELMNRAKVDGVESLISELRTFDVKSAQNIHPNNIKRIIRAIEIYRTTGKTLSEQTESSKTRNSPYNCLMIGLNFRCRQILYDRINARVDKMMNSGLLEETEYVLKSGASKTLLNAIGYKELLCAVNGECSLSDAVDKLKTATRRYAKRQITWFRQEKDINWLYADDYNSFDLLISRAIEMSKSFIERGK